jgi:cytochrome c-type biogenesis protein CcmE
MSPTQKKRFITYSAVLIILSVVAGLVMYALSQNMNAYYTPFEIIEAIQNNPKLLEKNVRLGGMVKSNSLQRSADLHVSFTVTDYKQDLKVSYKGILPDLFREGQGIIAEGTLQIDPNDFTTPPRFMATRILAKHDEKYMPETIKKRIGADS